MQLDEQDRPVGPTAHAWVMTFEAGGQVVFWESLNGERFAHHHLRDVNRSGNEGHGYVALDCVFNHRAFYANLQTK